MRWWLRLIVTLVLTPLLWQLTRNYLAWHEGMGWGDLLQQTPTVLAGIYMVLTLPALVLCGIVLTASDALLRRLGVDLLTVIVSPLLAWGIAAASAWAFGRFAPGPYAPVAAGAVPMLAVYGLVWGLTIREPRERRTVDPRTSTPEADPLPRETVEA